MHPAHIKAALEIQDYSQTQVARDCGVERTTVGAVIHGRSRSRRIEMRIAAITQLPLAELWPQWYGAKAKARRRAASSFTADALRAVMG